MRVLNLADDDLLNENEMKPRDLMKEIESLNEEEGTIDDCSLSTIEKGVAADLCLLHHENSPMVEQFVGECTSITLMSDRMMKRHF